MSVIETIRLSRTYRLGDSEIPALSDISCMVRPGSWTVVTGPSGSGKSTLLSLMAALDRPTSGRILVDGEEMGLAADTRQAWYRRQRCGIVFQEHRLLDRLAAWENVALPLVVSGLSLPQRFARACSLLEQVGLGNRARHLPRQLSGGERQRVSLARALAHRPRIIFADEPTAALDQETAKRVIAVFDGIRRQGGTLVVASHDPEICRRADQVLSLDGGRLA